MNTVVRENAAKQLVKPGDLFSFLPIVTSAGLTFFFYDAFWPVTLLSAPALWLSLTSYTHQARWEIARLYSKNRYEYDLNISPERHSYSKEKADEAVKVAESISSKDIYAAVFTKKPFEATLDKIVDESYGGSITYNVAFDGKEVAVQKLKDPPVFDIWEEALVNARKLK